MNNEIVKIDYLDTVEDNRKCHYWYGGDVVSIELGENKSILISAIGDVIGHIYNKEGESVARFKDKSNNGAFYTVASSYFENDEELLKSIFDYNPEKEELEKLGIEYYVIFDHNNWWEAAPVIDGVQYDIEMCLDGYSLDEAIKEVKENIDSILDAAE